MPVSKTQLHDIASAFLAAYKTLSLDAHLSLRAPDCVHIFAPASLNLPENSNEEFATHIRGLTRILEQFPVWAKELRVDETNRQVTIWANSKPYFRPEAKAKPGEQVVESEWEYQGEYVFMLDVNEEGKLVRTVEFLDSLATTRVLGMAARARENLGIE